MRTAVITGAGSGIGRASAIALSARGFDLALIGRTEATLLKTAALCKGSTRIVVADVGEAEVIADAFAGLRRVWPRLDLLFNNAGSNISTRPLDEQATSELHDVIKSNLLGALYCAREAFTTMRAQSPQGGRIINNGSVAAHAPRPGSASYTAAKHGITGLTKSLNLDGHRYGIGCCQIDIGNAATPRTEQMVQGILQADGSIRPEPRLALDIVAAQIVHLAELPSEAVIPFITVMPLGMPLFGRG